MNIKRPKITLDGIQIKSIDKAKLLASALNVIEEECGIHEVTIEIKDIFLCPWINLAKLNNTEMEVLIQELLTKIRKIQISKK